MSDDDEFLPPEAMSLLELVIDSWVRTGASVVSENGTPAGVETALLLALRTRTNGSPAGQEPNDWLLGLDQERATNLAQRLLVQIDIAYGEDTVKDILIGAAREAAIHAAVKDHPDADA